MVGIWGRLPLPSRWRPKRNDKAEEERKPVWGKKHPCGVYVFICPSPDKIWHKTDLRGEPSTDQDPCWASQKIACFPWASHLGAHEGSPHEDHGRTWVTPPHSVWQPKPPTQGRIESFGLPPPSRRRPKRSNKAEVERNQCGAKRKALRGIGI